MGLFQELIKTYDANEKYIAAYNYGDSSVLAPIYHSIKRANIEISIDSEGKFKSAKKLDGDDCITIFPVTENSQGRSGTSIRPHPLCDELGYYIKQNSQKREVYLENLKKWINSEYNHPILEAVYNYISNDSIVEDLKRCKLISLNKNGTVQDNDIKLFIRWNVINLEMSECWKNKKLIEKFIKYNKNLMDKNPLKGICMVTGEYTSLAAQHPKVCPSRYSNAKLISTNDDTGFSFRGRFENGMQAVTLGSESSQKSHNALRWLMERQSVSSNYGGRTFLCWNPNGITICQATGPFRVNKETINKPSDYKKQLSATLKGYMSTLPESEKAILASFDAATNGRMSVSYYNELSGSDFNNRLYLWDLHCCWYNGKYGIQSPSLIKIINTVYGNPISEKDKMRFKASDEIIKQQMQVLLSSRVDGYPMPRNYIEGLMHKLAKMTLYDSGLREDLLFTACSVIKKYRYDKFREELEMELNADKHDISYQYGRLLAVFEKVELSTYTQEEQQRETTAIRMQNVFCQRPMYATSLIEKQLERAYFPKMNIGSRSYFKNIIGEIMNNINSYPDTEWNKPLKETYVIGYYLQRKEFYTKKNKEENVDE